MKVKKMNRPNEGIKCMVDTCKYYMNGDYCTAEKIEVTKKYDDGRQDADCATYTPENV